MAVTHAHPMHFIHSMMCGFKLGAECHESAAGEGCEDLG